MKKKEKKKSKLKMWKDKMKATPRGKAILKLIYWVIFFALLFIFILLTSSIKVNKKEIENNNINIDSLEENNLDENITVPKTIKDMEQDLINKSFKYTYDIRILDNSYLFEGTKYMTYEVGYKNYTYNGNFEVIKYYIDDSGIYKINGKEKVLINDFYQGINAEFLDLNNLFAKINNLGLKLDEGNYGYPVYNTTDGYYTYTLNISKDGVSITDLSIVSIDGSISYLFTFSNIGDYDNE